MSEITKPPYHETMARKSLSGPNSEVGRELPAAVEAYAKITNNQKVSPSDLEAVLRFAAVLQWEGGTFLDLENFPKAVENLLKK